MNNTPLWLILQKMRLPLIVLIFVYTISIVGLLIINGQDNNGNIYHMSIFDAFYFITYSATTIGFGEIPYAFTYSQKIWVSMSIYLTVIGWLYSIGMIMSLMQDKFFLSEIAKHKFKKKIANMRSPFVIITGYNNTTKRIIDQIVKSGLRVVVIEQDDNKINDLVMQSYTPSIPHLKGDISLSITLENAGIKSIYCKYLVCLLEKDALNLRTSLTAKVLNPNVSLLVKSTTTIHTENLKDLEVENIINPFEIIAKNVDISLNRPNITKLKNWIYNKSLLDENDLYLKKGKYIICGFGRFGSEVYTVLKQNGIDVVCVDIDKNKLPRDNNISKDIIIGNGEDKNVLIQAEIMQSEVILALTNDDTTNLSILKTAQKLNKDLVAIARENEVQDLSIFSNSKIDKVFVLSDILISKAVNILANPYSEIFASLAQKQDEHWASAVVVDLVKTLGLNPIKFSITINETQAPQVVKLLKNKQNITLELLRISRHNNNHRNNLIPLLISNDGQNELLPKYDTQLKINDTILFASDDNAKDDVEYICQNHNEMNYVLTEYNTK